MLFPIQPVEDDRPPHPTVAACLPELPERAVGVRRPGDPLELARAVGELALSLHHHFAVDDPARDHEHRAFVVDPRLVPPVVARIPGAQAPPAGSTGPFPGFGQRTAADNALDAVRAHPLTALVGNVPFSNPEVELAVLRRRAAGRWLRVQRWNRKEGQNQRESLHA